MNTISRKSETGKDIEKQIVVVAIGSSRMIFPRTVGILRDDVGGNTEGRNMKMTTKSFGVQVFHEEASFALLVWCELKSVVTRDNIPSNEAFLGSSCNFISVAEAVGSSGIDSSKPIVEVGILRGCGSLVWINQCLVLGVWTCQWFRFIFIKWHSRSDVVRLSMGRYVSKSVPNTVNSITSNGTANG